MKLAIVYTSITGNTEELAEVLSGCFREQGMKTDCYPLENFSLSSISDYDSLVIGTYTWGDGDVPDELLHLQQELLRCPQLVTGIFGTGDRFYPKFCGAVDELQEIFLDAVPLKIELSPQSIDMSHIENFVGQVLGT
ncbi:flavodoxin domain-containing protein [Robertmurraya kyonggiensis]|uniref:Flavodoxin n=1 Tax=Robertmurraya kyonggiensis TaxID=1037680 RepID=A0A4U1D6Q3_9BACI|nr:flavodoxin domain-containing protein [Robertmurraya kyonggiensis]TKC18242.1 flavodoxin [Robertmurraya kyonggiensis]